MQRLYPLISALLLCGLMAGCDNFLGSVTHDNQDLTGHHSDVSDDDDDTSSGTDDNSGNGSGSLELRHTSPHTLNPNIIPQNEIFELTLAKSVDYGLAGNSRDVVLNVDFTAPLTGTVTTIYGFYYYTLASGKSLWKVRFVPKEVGQYTYTYALTHQPSATTNIGSAQFQVVTSNLPGFIRRSSTQNFRWEFANHTPFYPVGVNDELSADYGDRLGAFAWLDQSDAYNLRLLKQAGVNAYRMRHKNKWSQLCADDPNINGDGECEVFLPEIGIAFDERMRDYHEAGIHIYYAIFGNLYITRSFPAALSPEDKQLIKYSINRWGAYVDWWQGNNEQTPAAAWVSQMALYIKQHDPYQHPLSENFGYGQIPADTNLDINAPHWYVTENEFSSDQLVASNAAAWDQFNKPMMVGEQGNHIAAGGGGVIPGVGDRSWQSNSGLKMRLRLWSGFFKEVSYFFFHHGHTDANGGVYFGRDERHMLQTARRFFDFVLRQDSTVTPITVSDATLLRAYGLRSATAGIVAAYVHRYASHSGSVSGKTLTINVPQAGQGFWIDPASGQRVASVNLTSGGLQSILIPPIQVDLAFFTTPAALDMPPLARFDVSNPQDDGDLDNDNLTDYRPPAQALGAAPLSIGFDASPSTDWDGGNLSYHWDFGDGGMHNGVAAQHTYTAKGAYLVTLQITDNEGDSAEQSAWVYAVADTQPDSNSTPILAKQPARKIWGGQGIMLKPIAYDRELISGSYAPTVLDSSSYSASNLPSGATYQQLHYAIAATPNLLKHLVWVPDFLQVGNFVPQISVTDAGGLSNVQTLDITVAPPPLP